MIIILIWEITETIYSNENSIYNLIARIIKFLMHYYESYQVEWANCFLIIHI